MNRGTILIYDGFVSARYLSGSLQGDGSVEADPLSSVTYTVKAYDNPTLTLHGRPSDDQFEVTGYAANPWSHATMVFDTANNIGRFYGAGTPEVQDLREPAADHASGHPTVARVQERTGADRPQSGGGKDGRQSGLERFFDLSVTGNRVRLYVGDADTASVALRDDERHSIACVRFLLVARWVCHRLRQSRR